MSVVVIGAGMSGLIAAHVSDYTALVLESRDTLNRNFGNMVGARFLHDSPELRELFAYDDPSDIVHVSTDTNDHNTGLADYVRKTRKCELDEIPPSERDSAMNWGRRSFPFLPVEVNAWAYKISQKAGVVYSAEVEKIWRSGNSTFVGLRGDRTLEAERVLFTIPLPVIMRIMGMGSDDFRTWPTTVGQFRIKPRTILPTMMHYVTNPAVPITRITTKGGKVIVEASSFQTPELLQLMGEVAQEHLAHLGFLRLHTEAAGFGTFGHHFHYFHDFTERRSVALQQLADLGLLPLGRYAQYSHRIKTLETYQEAKRLLRPVPEELVP